MDSRDRRVRRIAVLGFALIALITGEEALCQSPVGEALPLPNLVTDSYTKIPLRDLMRKADLLQVPGCSNDTGFLRTPVSLADFVRGPATVEAMFGGTFQSIRILRVADPLMIRDAPEKVLAKVWNSKIQDAACFMMWSEMATWDIEALVQFTDGKKSELYTDGFHLAFQDHGGRVWFTRLDRIIQ